jgi:hypothetical protein
VRAVGAGSSWVVVGNGGAVRVRPARTVGGRPERGPPGHPRRPVSAGKQSGGSATENPTPATAGCPRRGSAREGDHTREGQPAGGAGSGRRGRPTHDASPEAVVGPPRRARRVFGTAAAGRSAGREQPRPAGLPGPGDVRAARPHRVRAGPRGPCAPGSTRTRDARTTQGPPTRWRTAPAGRARWCTTRRAPGDGHLTVTYPAVETAG